jgi:protoporphyrinogen oxidase
MKAIPQYNKGYFDIRAKVDEGLVNHPGIFLGGNYICGVAFGSCVEWGVDTAPKVPIPAPSPCPRAVASQFCRACL